MQQATLDTAIRLGQLIRLLTPFALHEKEFGKTLSHIRSRVEDMVFGSTFDDAFGTSCETTLVQAEDALVTSMVTVLDMKKLLAAQRHLNRSGDFPLLRSVFKTGSSRTSLHRMEKALILDKVFQTLAIATSLKKAPSRNTAMVSRATVLHAYASAVKNSFWLGTLLRLNVSATVAASENSFLLTTHSSRQGHDDLALTLRKICAHPTMPAEKRAKPHTEKPFVMGKAPSRAVTSRATPSKVEAKGLFAMQVVFNPQSLLAHPTIAQLLAEQSTNDDLQRELEQLIGAVTAPLLMTEGANPEILAQGLLDTFVEGLIARQKVIAAEQLALRKKADDTARQQAVVDLKKIDPKLLKLLKSNPDLLKEV